MFLKQMGNTHTHIYIYIYIHLFNMAGDLCGSGGREVGKEGGREGGKEGGEGRRREG